MATGKAPRPVARAAGVVRATGTGIRYQRLVK